MTKIRSGMDQGDERKRTVEDVSKDNPITSKPGSVHHSGIESGGNLPTVQAASGMEAA